MSDDIRLIGAGLTALTRRQEVIAGNLANLTTPGYRRQASFVRLLESQMEGASRTRRALHPTLTTGVDFSAGPLRQTESPLDVAIEGEGFFAVRTPEGTGFTRSGRFTRNAVGELATPAGQAVLGEGGPIVLGAAGSVEIGEDGTVTVDGTQVGKLRLSTFARPELLWRGEHGLFEAPVGAMEQPVEQPSLRQGALEESNVDASLELIKMIETQRSYERKHRAIQVISEARAALTRAAQGI